MAASESRRRTRCTIATYAEAASGRRLTSLMRSTRVRRTQYTQSEVSERAKEPDYIDGNGIVAEVSCRLITRR